MSENSSIPANITSMTDVDFYREWDGATTGITVYNNRQSDWDEVLNIMEQGYVVSSVTDV